MRNGPYELVVAPTDYPGMKYRGRYVYEHHLVYWQHTGEVVPKGKLLHHKNERKRDNWFSNLEVKDVSKHSRDHARRAKPAVVVCSWCANGFETIARNYRLKLRRGQKRFYCCRSHQVSDQQRLRRINSGVRVTAC